MKKILIAVILAILITSHPAWCTDLDDLNQSLPDAEKRAIADIKALINKGVDINENNSNGVTPLFMAAKNGHIEAVKLLLDAGADVNRASYISGAVTAPTIITVTGLEVGREGITHYKLKIDDGSYSNEIPLSFMSVDITYVNLSNLPEGYHTVSVIGKDLAGNWQAIEDALTISWVVDFKAPVSNIFGTPSGSSNTTAATLAVGGEKISHYKYRIGYYGSYSDEISVSTPIDFSNLAKGSYTVSVIGKNSAGNWQAITTSLRIKVTVPASNIGVTPLFMASQNGHTEIVKLLLDAGADANKTTTNGFTPLYTPVRRGDTEIVKLLLDAGADVNKDKIETDGVIRIVIGSYYGSPEVVKVLVNAGADANRYTTRSTPLYIAVERGNVEVVRLLLDAGVSLNRQALLTRATRRGYTEIVKLLLDAGGVDVNKASHRGETPLFIASQEGHTEIIKLLLDSGADVNKASHEGESPLFIASQEGHTEIVKLLLAAKADVNVKRYFEFNGKRHNALSIAELKGNTDIVNILKDHGATDGLAIMNKENSHTDINEDNSNKIVISNREEKKIRSLFQESRRDTEWASYWSSTKLTLCEAYYYLVKFGLKTLPYLIEQAAIQKEEGYTWVGRYLIDDQNVKTPEDVYEYNNKRKIALKEDTLSPDVLLYLMKEITPEEEHPEREEGGLGRNYSTECYEWLKWWEPNKKRYIFDSDTPPEIPSIDKPISTAAENGLLTIHATASLNYQIIEKAAAEMGIEVHIHTKKSRFNMLGRTSIHMKSVTFDEFLYIIGRGKLKYIKKGTRYIIGEE